MLGSGIFAYATTDAGVQRNDEAIVAIETEIGDLEGRIRVVEQGEQRTIATVAAMRSDLTRIEAGQREIVQLLRDRYDARAAD